MNKLTGNVLSVKFDELFAQVTIDCDGATCSSCILLSDHDLPYCKVGNRVEMTFKESDTILTLHSNCEISCRNRFKCIIKDIVYTSVMTRVITDFKGVSIVSMITKDSADMLNLQTGKEITCLVKSTSVILYASGN
jgi:molybdate transport system regulatory protein